MGRQSERADRGDFEEEIPLRVRTSDFDRTTSNLNMRKPSNSSGDDSRTKTRELSKIVLGWKLLQTFGVAWCATRTWLKVEEKFGVLQRKLPIRKWEDRPLRQWLRADVPSDPKEYAKWRREHGVAFFFENPDVNQIKKVIEPYTKRAIAEAEMYLAGDWRYFFHDTAKVGFPPKWNENPFTG